MGLFLKRASLKLFFSLALLLTLVALPALARGADSTHVPVGSWVYPALERLEAEGLIGSAVLTSRPVSRFEAARLVNEAQAGRPSPAAARLIERLKRELAPDNDLSSGAFRSMDVDLHDAGGRYIYSDGAPHFLNLNNKGDVLVNGSNFRAGFSGSAGFGSHLGFFLNPEVRYPEGASGDGQEVVLVEGYGSLNLWNIELTAGRQALWWGPGVHGALLLSDNARPFDLIKLTNPQPFALPWIFRHIGLLKLTGFVTRLEESRDFANPYLAGLRLDWKPYPYVSIGLARTAVFGGAGRHVDSGVIWDVITASNENVAGEPGNQLASFDAKVVLPFSFQKVVIYGELGGEDEAGALPSRNAHLLGVYLPGAFGSGNLDLRFEYAETYISKYPGMWYNHHIYTTGYTYDGRVIGHHMGTDAKDLFVSASYGSGYGDFEFIFDMEVSGRAVKTKTRSAALTWNGPLSQTAELDLGYYFDRRTNIDGVAGQDEDSHSVMAGLKMNF